MLTDSDLKKIGQVVDVKVNSAIDKKVGNLIEQKLKPIEADISGLRPEVAKFKSEIGDVRGQVNSSVKELKEFLVDELRPLKAEVSKIRRNVDTMVGFFDHEYMELQARVARIEEHLNLKPQSRS